jgi:2-polyprenyl-3-methyl-5-hydroxy-6-metoxy-1,4-benzoquinol methylase
MRHIRSHEFAAALADGSVPRVPTRWTDVASNPNAAAALALRAEELRAAWRPPIANREAFLEDRCRGRHVLDIGCVAHDLERMRSPRWLHARLAEAADRCIGVDVVADGVRAMQELGYNALAHDLSTGLGALESELPFDVIVAGELIEHIESLDMLLRVASEALAPDGDMILTTPNPYAPHRVRAGQLGIVWENVDHIMYAFPGGIAELASRHGLVLAEAAVTKDRERITALGCLKAIRRGLLGTGWRTVGYTAVGPRRVRRVMFGPIGRVIRGMAWPRRRFLGETFVYVIRQSPGRVTHPDADGSSGPARAAGPARRPSSSPRVLIG